MKMVTNEKIFEYYKKKEEFPIVTEKFLQEYYKKENFQAYEAFYFYCTQKKIICPKYGEKHILNYEKLKEWIGEKSEFKSSVDELKKYINIDKSIPCEKIKNYNVPSQKWHLITSYFGQCIAEYITNNKKPGEFLRKTFNKSAIRYYPLKLWMAETAGAKSVEKIAQEISAGDLQEAKNIIKSNQLWEEILNNVIKEVETTL